MTQAHRKKIMLQKFQILYGNTELNKLSDKLHSSVQVIRLCTGDDITETSQNNQTCTTNKILKNGYLPPKHLNIIFRYQPMKSLTRDNTHQR
jgi:hypothetical protein